MLNRIWVIFQKCSSDPILTANTKLSLQHSLMVSASLPVQHINLYEIQLWLAMPEVETLKNVHKRFEYTKHVGDSSIQSEGGKNLEGGNWESHRCLIYHAENFGILLIFRQKWKGRMKQSNLNSKISPKAIREGIQKGLTCKRRSQRLLLPWHP